MDQHEADHGSFAGERNGDDCAHRNAATTSASDVARAWCRFAQHFGQSARWFLPIRSAQPGGGLPELERPLIERRRRGVLRLVLDYSMSRPE